jgi:hypothetical protein
VPPELQEQKIQEQQEMLGQEETVGHMGEEIQMLAAGAAAGVLVGVGDLEVMVVMVAIVLTIEAALMHNIKVYIMAPEVLVEQDQMQGVLVIRDQQGLQDLVEQHHHLLLPVFH